VQQGLIFDLDGTLVDSLRGIADSLNHALRENGLAEHPDSAVRGFIGDGARMLVTRAGSPGASTDLIDRLEAAFKAHYDRSWALGTRPFHGIPELLTALQEAEYPLAVLSNKPDPFTQRIVSSVFPEIHFTAVLGNRPGQPHKPDPAGALGIAQMLKLEPSHCTLIGDSTMDLDTAARAGMEAVAVTWGYHDREKLEKKSPTHVVDDVAGLRQLLLRAHSPLFL
jgi:phosphoglycolate phosphatase